MKDKRGSNEFSPREAGLQRSYFQECTFYTRG